MKKYKLTAYERETIILYNESEKQAEISTYNKALIKKLEELIVRRPKEAIRWKDRICPNAYKVPKSWIKIRPGNIISEDEKAKKAKRMKQTIWK